QAAASGGPREARTRHPARAFAGPPASRPHQRADLEFPAAAAGAGDSGPGPVDETVARILQHGEDEDRDVVALLAHFIMFSPHAIWPRVSAFGFSLVEAVLLNLNSCQEREVYTAASVLATLAQRIEAGMGAAGSPEFARLCREDIRLIRRLADRLRESWSGEEDIRVGHRQRGPGHFHVRQLPSAGRAGEDQPGPGQGPALGRVGGSVTPTASSPEPCRRYLGQQAAALVVPHPRLVSLSGRLRRIEPSRHPFFSSFVSSWCAGSAE
ncbi:unnamed protein product, partial [Prorocentrum cordatum]